MKKKIISIVAVLLMITVTVPFLFSCGEAEVGGNDNNTTKTEIKIKMKYGKVKYLEEVLIQLSKKVYKQNYRLLLKMPDINYNKLLLS